MIIGSLLLLPSIGGGVCQTATTLFNNAFELGLPILERHNHSFYISHYPLGRVRPSRGEGGLRLQERPEDGDPDQDRLTTSTLTFSFYGTDPKRRVAISTSERTNWRSPQTTYALDPYAPRGSVRTVAGSNQSGFDVTVTRKVYEHGSCCAGTRSRATTSPSARPRSTVPGARSRARTSCSPASRRRERGAGFPRRRVNRHPDGSHHSSERAR